MDLRWAQPADAPELASVFYASVRDGPSPYSQAQRCAWLPAPPSGPAWVERLAGLDVILAEVDGCIAGFMSLETGGYIDLAFIRPEHQGIGLFRQLYMTVEHWACRQGEPLLWTHASLMAQPAFRKMGFRVIHHETVSRHGETLTRARMEKPL